MFFKRQPPPPPPKKWYTQPALILTIVAMFVLGPVGVIYNSMSEELKKKVDNQTLQLMIEKDREALKRQADELKDKEKKDETQDAAIIENQKNLIILRQQQSVMKVEAPKEVRMSSDSKRRVAVESKPKIEKKFITREVFDFYMKLSPKDKIEFRKLHPAYQALPPPE